MRNMDKDSAGSTLQQPKIRKCKTMPAYGYTPDTMERSEIKFAEDYIEDYYGFLPYPDYVATIPTRFTNK